MRVDAEDGEDAQVIRHDRLLITRPPLAMLASSLPPIIEHVTDLPPDLPRLRTLETWLRYSLARVQQEIAARERREQERQRGIAARPPRPDWVIERGLNRT
ncbi:hypothetical protein ACE1SV_64790 [Streptomyces sennicomposti]